MEAQSVSVCANGQLAAVFNKNLPAGDYTLRLVKGEDIAESLKTFTYSGTYVSGLQVDFKTKLILPGTLFATYYRESCNTFYVEYTNNSEFAIAAPLLHLVCKNNRGEEKGLMTLDASLVGTKIPKSQTTVPEGFSTDLYMIASGETIGVLQPGETARIPVYWRGWLGKMEHVDFSLEVVAQDHTSEVNWEHELFGVLDEYERAENAVYLECLQNHLGNTWGEYVVKLSQAATEIYRDYGFEVKNADELKAYLIEKAHVESMEIVASQMVQAALGNYTEAPTITKVDLSRKDNGQLNIYVRWDNLVSDQFKIKQYNLEISANENFDTANTLSVNVKYSKETDPSAEYKGVDTNNILRTRLNYKIRVRAEYEGGTFSDWSEVETYILQETSVQGLVYIYQNGQWVPAVSTNSETGETTILTNASKKTYVLIHGMNNSIGSTWLKRMAEKLYALDSSANILAVNWGEWAGSSWNAIKTANYTDDVAERLAFQLFGTGKIVFDNFEFYALGLNSSNMYIIGHSHGAQIAGLTGEYAKTKYHATVKKITALDPSEDKASMFNYKNPSGAGWGANSADFVDVYKSSDLYGGELTWGKDNFLLVEKGKMWTKEYVLIDDPRDLSTTHAFAVDWFIKTITTSPNTTSPGFWWNSNSWGDVVKNVTLSEPDQNNWNGLIVADRSGHWRFEALSTALNGNYVLNESTGQSWNYPGNWEKPFNLGTTLNLVNNKIVESLDITYELQYQYNLLPNVTLTAGNSAELNITVTDHSDITSTPNHANNQIKVDAVKTFVGTLYYEDATGRQTTLNKEIIIDRDFLSKINPFSSSYTTSGKSIVRYFDIPTASELYAAFGENGITTKKVGNEQHICYNLKLKIEPVTPKDFTELYSANDAGVINITIDTGFPYCSTEKIPSQTIRKDEIARCLLKAVGGKETLKEKPMAAMGLNPDPDSPQVPLEGLRDSNFELINEGIYRYRWVNLTTGETIADVVSSNPIYDVPDVSVNLGIGTYEFELTVWDQYGFTASDKTSVCILEDPYDDGDHGVSNEGKSVDPNEIIGPSGNDGWINGEETLAYQINFENDETATAPAQRVDVEMYLDEDLDWSTFQFTGFGWADVFEGLGNGSYTINKRIETSVTPLGEEDPVTIYVEVNAGIDLLSGRVYATFQTLQYTTLDGALEEEELLAPMSANIGFLLPSVKEDGEKVDSRGDGFLTYTVKAKKPLVTNTEITSVANIQFDFGEIIATNQTDPHDASQGTDPAKEAPLLIDVTAPTSTLNALEAQTNEPSVLLSWTGQDEGSGIAFYDLYVSINGGNFELIEGGLNVTEYEYTFPTKNKTYSFKVVATDHLGWVELDNQAEVTINYGIPTNVIYCLTTTPSDLDSHVVSANESPINEWNTVNLEFWSDFTTTETFTVVYDSTFYELDQEASRNQEGVVLTFGDSQTDESGKTTVDVTIDCIENIEIGSNTLLASLEFSPIRDLLVGELIVYPIFVNDLPLDTTVYSVIYDMNESGGIDIQDLVQFARLFGSKTAENPDAWKGDFNCDGTVEINDLVLFARNFGLTTAKSGQIRYAANYTPHVEDAQPAAPALPALETSVAWETPTWSGTTQNLVPEPAAALPTITDRAWNDLWSELEEEEEERLAEQRRVTEFAWE